MSGDSPTVISTWSPLFLTQSLSTFNPGLTVSPPSPVQTLSAGASHVQMPFTAKELFFFGVRKLSFHCVFVFRGNVLVYIIMLRPGYRFRFLVSVQLY